MTYLKIICLLSLMLIIESSNCQSIEYYKDFDLYEMKGIEKINSCQEYSCVKVYKNSNQKYDSIIFSLVKDKYEDVIKFEKNDSLILNKWVDYDDGFIYFTSYGNSKIIERVYEVLENTYKPGFLLGITISRKKDSKKIIQDRYFFDANDSIEFNLSTNERVMQLEKAKKTIKNEIKVNDNRIYKYIDIKNDIPTKIDCYSLGDTGLSFYWWQHFIYLFKECDK